MHFYEITIGSKQEPRLRFIAMATDSCSAVVEHAEKAQPNERMDVQPLPRESLERAISQRRGQ